MKLLQIGILKELIFFFFLGSIMIACSNDKEANNAYYPQYQNTPLLSKAHYIIGIHPLHNPQRLYRIFNPLAEYLNTRIPNAQFSIEASRNYAAFDKKLYTHKFDFALPNPFQTINAADKGYKIFAKMGDDENFRGIILVRKDSHIYNVKDLKGKSISYPAPTALAATMMPQYYLHTHGININKDVKNNYVGSQESSIMNVYLKQSAAAATWPPPWRALVKERPELAEELDVRWETKSLPNNGFVVSPNTPDSIVQQVQDLLVHLHKNPEGRQILFAMELSRFERADSTTYQSVRDFVKTFNQTIRSTASE